MLVGGISINSSYIAEIAARWTGSILLGLFCFPVFIVDNNSVSQSGRLPSQAQYSQEHAGFGFGLSSAATGQIWGGL